MVRLDAERQSFYERLLVSLFISDFSTRDNKLSNIKECYSLVQVGADYTLTDFYMFQNMMGSGYRLAEVIEKTCFECLGIPKLGGNAVLHLPSIIPNLERNNPEAVIACKVVYFKYITGLLIKYSNLYVPKLEAQEQRGKRTCLGLIQNFIIMYTE